jgi:hypothetical protein
LLKITPTSYLTRHAPNQHKTYPPNPTRPYHHLANIFWTLLLPLAIIRFHGRCFLEKDTINNIIGKYTALGWSYIQDKHHHTFISPDGRKTDLYPINYKNFEHIQCKLDRSPVHKMLKLT